MSRFQKRIKILPGVRLNLSKSGASFSFGGRGLTYNSRGKATIGLPGTGLSHSFTPGNGSPKQVKAGSKNQEPAALPLGCGFLALLIGAFIPGLTLVGVPLVIWSYEKRIKTYLASGIANPSDNSEGLNQVLIGGAFGLLGIFLPIVSLLSLVLIANGYENRIIQLKAD